MIKRLLLLASLLIAFGATAQTLQPSQQNTRPNIGAPAFTAPGVAISTSGTAAVSALPVTSLGAIANRVRLAATAATYVRFGNAGAQTTATTTISAAGSGYLVGDSITLTGGTFITAAKATVATSKLISAAVLTAGSGYNVADTITMAGGTFATKAVLTLATTKLVSAVIDAGGTLYVAGDTITLAGGTAGTAAVVTVDTVDGVTGAVLTFHITTPGSYTVQATTFTQGSTTSVAGTGATFKTGLFGVLTYTVSTAGSYTVEPTTFTQFGTTGSGTGATFNTLSFGVLSATVTNGGTYSALPSNPVSQGASSGAGTGAQFTVTWLTAAAAGDLMLPAGASLIVDTVGMGVVSAVQVTAGGILQISPLEN